MIDRCPYCKSDGWYYEKWVVSYAQFYEFNGESVCASEPDGVRGGKRKYCAECNKDITKHLKVNE